MLAIDRIKKLDVNTLKPITLISGSDIGQYQILKEQLLKQIGYDTSQLNYSYFDLSTTDFKGIMLDLESLSFFGDNKIVIIDEFLDLTTQRKSYLDETDMKRFEEYVKNPIISTHLIILSSGSLDGKRRIVKLLKREADLFEAIPLSNKEYDVYFKTYMMDLGLTCDNLTFEYLKEKSNANFSDTEKNLNFLKSVIGQGEVTVTDIEQIIPKTLQDNIFELSSFLLKGNVDKVNTLIRELRLQKQDEIQFIAYLLSRFRLMLQLRLLNDQGLRFSSLEADLSEYTGSKANSYYVKRTLQDAQKVSLSFLKRAIILLIECDYEIKLGKFDKDYLFDIVILKIISEYKCLPNLNQNI